MNKIVQKSLAAAFFLFLSGAYLSCGNDARMEDDDVPRLTQGIHVIPEAYFGASYLSFAVVRTKTIEQGESVRLVAELLLDGETLDSDIAGDYILNATWTIDGESYISLELDHTFSEAGAHDVILSTVDYLQDTLRDTVTLLVSTPVSIAALYPPDGYKQLDPFDSAGITLSWETSGIDDWETATCLLYASRSRGTVWDSFVDTVFCDRSHQIKGPFSTADSAALKDSSILYFWGIKVHVDDVSYAKNRDSTEIRSFRTALTGTTLAHLDVPVVHRFNGNSVTPETRISLLTAMGDTIQSDTVTETPAIFSFSGIQAQTGLRVSVQELKLTEYTADEVSLDITPSSYNVLDTITLTDTTPPQRWPATEALATGDSIRFYWLDNGSGINASKTAVLLDGDTLSYHIHGAIVSFANSCATTCSLYFNGSDMAGNKVAAIHWKIQTTSDSLFLTGPFDATEDP